MVRCGRAENGIGPVQMTVHFLETAQETQNRARTHGNMRSSVFPDVIAALGLEADGNLRITV
jgi:hypothetical protein